MKTGLIAIFVTLSILALRAQPALYEALGKGDVTGISAYFGNKVELTIGEKEAVISKEEAQAQLREFFAANPAKGYRAMHTGASKGNESNYTIGELATDTRTFRVYIYFTQEGDRRTIAELRFE